MLESLRVSMASSIEADELARELAGEPGFDIAVLDNLACEGAGWDVATASDAQLLAAAEGYETTRRFLDAGQGHVLAELDTRRVTDTGSDADRGLVGPRM